MSKASVAIFVSAVLVCLCSYTLYSYRPKATFKRQRFTYSTYGLFKTVRSIRNKNCRAFKIQPNHNLSISDCGKLDVCNYNAHGTTSLPIGCARRLPKAIIIGNFKTGTSDPIDLLALHPAIVLRRNPYDISFLSSEDWPRRIRRYKNAMPPSLQWQITMDKSPAYSLRKEVPRRLKLVDPNLKLVFIVRNPVDRFISQWTSRNVFEITLETIQENFAIIAKLNFTNNYFSNFSKAINMLKDLDVEKRKSLRLFMRSLRSSIYDIPFVNYLKHFDRSQIHVVDSEKLKRNPSSVLQSIESFLGLEQYINQDDFLYNHRKGVYCLQDPGLDHSSMCFGNRMARSKPDITDHAEIKSKLQRFFYPHIKRFYNLSGINFHWD